MTLTLVVLAAGMGSRFGGLKQLEAVGPTNETILDYAVFDALRSGFGRVVFVIRRDFEAAFRAVVGLRYTGQCEVVYAYQELNDLPAGFAPSSVRTKPWGTGHAVWCARDVLHGPFAAINADDFYGRDSFERLADFLRAAGSVTSRSRFAMTGFCLANTLSKHGAVARGVCRVSGEGTLLEVVERTGIRHNDVGPGRTYSGEEIVSMNCWGLTPAVFAPLERQFTKFLTAQGCDLTAEFYLPTAISAMVADGGAEVRVLPTQASWFGVTYREDRACVVAAIRELVNQGEYPDALRAVAPVSP